MIKKIFIILFFCDLSFGCLCSGEIDSAHDALVEKVKQSVEGQKDVIKKDLLDEIDKNIEDIKKQNAIIEKLIEGEKHKALQNNEIIFLLEKIIELKTAGEM